MQKSADAFRTISEVAVDLDIPQHVLRFWESKFPQITPLKRRGGRRYYRPQDVDLLRSIRRLLYADGYTIRGVQKILKLQGVRAVSQMSGVPAPDEHEEMQGADVVEGNEPHEVQPQGGSFEPSALFDDVGPLAAPSGGSAVPHEQLAALADELRRCSKLLADARLAAVRPAAVSPHSVDEP